MRLSELKYEDVVRPGKDMFYMHTDATDALTGCGSQADLDKHVEKLMKRYGDMECSIHNQPQDAWYDIITFHDEKWEQDHKEFCEAKGRWVKVHFSD